MKKPSFENESTQVFLSVWEKRKLNFKFKQHFIFPKNTYSPWLENDFLDLFEKVNNYTLVDIYRCFELFQIAQKMKNVSGAILEVGVWKGGTAFLLAKANESKSTIYLCDTFEGVVKAGENDSIYKGGEHSDTSLEEVKSLLVENGITNFEILKGIFPEETSAQIKEEQFKICHIDVDVYQSAKDIFEWVWPKLILGGVVVFDDYGFAACEGITQLVNEILEKRNDLFFSYNINGHAILVKQNYEFV